MQIQSGWHTATDRKIRQWLVRLDRIRRKMIHRAGEFDQKIDNLEELAVGMELSLPTEADDGGVGDGIARPAGRPIPFRYKLDGTDQNVPSLSAMNMRNVDGFTLLTALDLHITTATRLDARNATHRITAEEGTILFSGLLEMWKVCDECGGDEKIIGVNEGVLPAEEPRGPTASGILTDRNAAA